MAVAIMLSSGGAARLASAVAPIASFLADFVDDSVPPDELAMVFEKLSDVGRTMLPGLFGTAIADQKMLNLGYRESSSRAVR